MTASKHSTQHDCCSHGHQPAENKTSGSPTTGHNHSGENHYLPSLISLALLSAGLVMDHLILPSFFKGWIRLVWYLIAYFPVGFPVLRQGVRLALSGSLFTEFFLMGVATIGAFAIGEYPEGVAVMLFYAVGELFQHSAVDRAKKNIQALLDIRPDKATVRRNNEWVDVRPSEAVVGDILQLKSGEKVALDGELLSNRGSFNTSALTGESKPATILANEPVLAGMINMDQVTEVRVTRKFEDSSLARILKLVQDATKNKAIPELFIRKFARIYTPVVTFLAIGLAFLPYFFVENYQLSDWLYRACVFLVISCPCALVISIPLGYFGGIGAASRHGILFKGSNFLDLMTKVDTVVMDKTGTLTKGVFKVTEVNSPVLADVDLVRLLAAVESHSNHPAAKAITEYAANQPIDLTTTLVSEARELPGMGIIAVANNQTILAGNTKLLDFHSIPYPKDIAFKVETLVVSAIDGQYSGYITIADEIKEDSREAIRLLREQGIKHIQILSGDKQSIVQKTASLLQIDQAFGDLLPENKVERLKSLKSQPGAILAFVGDGINDAPALALSDVGIAMGGLGSDAAIETADVIIQTDQPSRIATAIKIGKATQTIVWQNISMAFGVKVVVLLLGAGGIATLWEAVFADVGVALLAILNAIRIQRIKF